jgi:Spy/CpxP family protein refolding chaperone
VSSVPKRIWVVALAVSIALNMFCLGVFAARHMGMRGRGGPDHEGGPRAFMHHSGLRNAGPEVQAILKQQREGVRERVHALSDARKRAREAIKAEPFDSARVEAAFKDVREQTSAMQTHMESVLSTVAAKLTPEQRKRLANALWSSRSDVLEP